MKPNGILNWLYQYMLEEYFSCDTRHMAIELRVTEKTLSSALKKTTSAESMLLFEQLMEYCLRKKISMDQILMQYTNRDS